MQIPEQKNERHEAPSNIEKAAFQPAIPSPWGKSQQRKERPTPVAGCFHRLGNILAVAPNHIKQGRGCRLLPKRVRRYCQQHTYSRLTFAA